MTQLVQWINDNWLAVAIPASVFLAFWVAGLWLRRIAFDAFNQWLIKTKWEPRQLFIDKTHTPFLHWFLLLGAHISIQVSTLPPDAKTIAGKILASLFVFSLTWVAVSLSEKTVKLYLPKVRLYLAKVKAPEPPTTLALNVIRATVVVVAVSILLGIWGVPSTWGILVIAGGVVIAGLAIRDAIGYKSRFLKVRKLIINLMVIAGLALVVWTAYRLFTHQLDATSGTLVFLLEVGFLTWAISVLRSHKYKRIKPSFKLVSFLLLGVALVGTFAGVQPMSMYKNNLVDRWESYRAAQEAEEAEKVAEAIAMTPVLIKEAPTKAETKSGPTVTQTLKVEEAEREAFELINAVREEAGVPPTKWSDELYELSKKHTQEMADRGELFHTPVGAEHGENAWGGMGYYHYRYEELAKVIVGSWMSSPLHKAWLLHAPIKESVVSIVVSPDGQYASWSFWTGNLGRGPALVEKIVREWRNSGSDKPWIDWLISEGYLD